MRFNYKSGTAVGGVDGYPPTVMSLLTTTTQTYLCPDLLRYEQIGAADNWRGRVVRGFFWLMRCWTPSIKPAVTLSAEEVGKFKRAWEALYRGSGRGTPPSKNVRAP